MSKSIYPRLLLVQSLTKTEWSCYCILLCFVVILKLPSSEKLIESTYEEFDLYPQRKTSLRTVENNHPAIIVSGLFIFANIYRCSKCAGR